MCQDIWLQCLARNIFVCTNCFIININRSTMIGDEILGVEIFNKITDIAASIRIAIYVHCAHDVVCFVCYTNLSIYFARFAIVLPSCAFHCLFKVAVCKLLPWEQCILHGNNRFSQLENNSVQKISNKQTNRVPIAHIYLVLMIYTICQWRLILKKT